MSTDVRAAISPGELAQIVRRVAGQPELWDSQVRYSAGERFYVRLEQGDGYEVWLLTWLPGQQTGFHDHGESSGAFLVVSGGLTETAVVTGKPEPLGRTLPPGTARLFGPHYVHDVRNDSTEPAVSIHAYSPPLSSMRRFEVAGDGALRVIAEERTW
jgi:predicted metal-dependent enzyme (double-stranded beta helix superfamily)